MSHDGRSKSISPFVIIDNKGIEQRIKVVEKGDSDDPLIAGYSYVEATGSTYIHASSSHQHLEEIASFSSDLSSSTIPAINDISSSISSLSSSLLLLTSDISSSIVAGLDDVKNKLSETSSSLLVPLNQLTSSIDNYTVSFNEYTSSLLLPINDISKSVSNIDLGPLQELANAVNLVTSSVDQILRFNRATHVYSKIFTKNELFSEADINVPRQIDLHSHPSLNPTTDSVTDIENFISKAIEVVIQNSTNKNVFVKVSYDPSQQVSSDNYTIKIAPGIIYNSEANIANMRHIIAFSGSTHDQLYGELATTIVYNTGLNSDYTSGETFVGKPVLTSLSTNFFLIYFNGLGVTPTNKKRSVVSEWNIGGTSGYKAMKVSGQARVSKPNQQLKLYLTSTPDNAVIAEQIITSTTPVIFDLSYQTQNNIPPGNYEFIAEAYGIGDIGDARILFADLLKYT